MTSTASVCTVSLHRDVATNVFLAACTSRVDRAGVLINADGDADDPPYETVVRGVESCSVSSVIFFSDSDSG